MSQDIPEPISPQEVDVMNLADAQEAYRPLSQPLQQARADWGTQTRLGADLTPVRARVPPHTTSAGGPAGGSNWSPR